MSELVSWPVAAAFVTGAACCYALQKLSSAPLAPADKPSASPSSSPSTFPGLGGPAGPMKLVLCARQDLKMGKGKVAAQCCHATLGVVERVRKGGDDHLLRPWRNFGQAKVVVKVPDEAGMLDVEERAAALGLPTYLVCDAGRTQIAAGSKTVIGVLGPVELVDRACGHLKLL